MRAWLAMLALAGCQERTSLADTPIVGGTDEVVAAVREAMLAFERDTGGGRVHLTEVRIAPIPTAGRFDSNFDRITLDLDSVPGANLTDTVNHELCHALDLAEDLMRERRELWDELGETMYDPAEALVYDPEEGGPHHRQREAFAGWCSRGAMDAQLLAHGCDGELAAVTEAMRWLAEHVWTGATPLGAVAAHPGPGWSLETLFPSDDVDFSETAHPDVVEIVSRRDLSQYERELRLDHLDLRTGERGPFELEPAPDARRTTVVPEGLSPNLQRSLAGWPTGPAAALGSLTWHYPGQSAARLLWSDGDGWSRVGDGCAELSHQEIFDGAGEVWVGWAEDGIVRTRPVAAP